jgi:hypothetical protein
MSCHTFPFASKSAEFSVDIRKAANVSEDMTRAGGVVASAVPVDVVSAGTAYFSNTACNSSWFNVD